MGKRNSFFRAEVLPLGEQLRQMALQWPGFQRTMYRSEVSWVGQLTPTPLSDTYVIRVTYRRPRRPVVEVVSPRLRTRPGEKIPHTFPGERLCLHLHGEWKPNMDIASTIIKWSSFWLFFYEIWLITGRWEGGGHEGSGRKNE